MHSYLPALFAEARGADDKRPVYRRLAFENRLRFYHFDQFTISTGAVLVSPEACASKTTQLFNGGPDHVLLPRKPT